MKVLFAFAVAATLSLAQTTPPAAQALPSAPAPATVPPDTVVAIVDGHPVTAEQAQNLILNAGPQAVSFFQRQPKEALQQIFIMHYLGDQAEMLKLGERSPLREQLEAMRHNILAEAMVSEERNSYPVSEKQIIEFYTAHQAQFEEAKIKVLYIGFQSAAPAPKGNSTDDTAEAARQALLHEHPANARSELEAKALADNLVKQLRGGADFAKLVAEYSDDSTSKAVGGDFPSIKQASPYPAELKKAVFAMKPGDISDAVRQSGGFYIIKLQEIKAQPVADVSAQIVQHIRDDHRNEYMNALQQRFKPQIENPDFFMHPNLGGTPPPKP